MSLAMVWRSNLLSFRLYLSSYFVKSLKIKTFKFAVFRRADFSSSSSGKVGKPVPFDPVKLAVPICVLQICNGHFTYCTAGLQLCLSLAKELGCSLGSATERIIIAFAGKRSLVLHSVVTLVTELSR
jgi:hypothetical protein